MSGATIPRQSATGPILATGAEEKDAQETAPDARRVAFGLGRLHHVLTPKGRERIILGALDAGMNHFDMAPAYGEGLTESEVGRVLKGRRPHVTLATKFGIPCSSLGGRNAPLYYANKAFRKAFSRSYGGIYAVRDFSPDTAVASVEASLKRLRTDYIDYLFFHEPRHARDVTGLLATIETLEKLRSAGKIRHYGISGFGELLLAARRDGIVVGDAVQFMLDPHARTLARTLPPTHLRTAYGLVRFLSEGRRAERLDYAHMLAWFFQSFPATVPILATNRPAEIGKLGTAIAQLT